MKLLCPTDFSKPAAEAADVAAALAAKQGLPLQLLYCAVDWIGPIEFAVVNPVDEAAPRLLKDEASKLEATGISVSPLLTRGIVDHEICSAATDTEMIVMASTGRGMAERWLIGSVAERVAESAPVPTLVVRNAAPLLEWQRDGRPLRILCGVDFTVSADAAIAAVKKLVALGPVEVEAGFGVDRLRRSSATPKGALHVSDETLDLQRDIWDRLRQVLGDVPVTVHVRHRDETCDVDFVRLADERKADLIVIGTHQCHGLKRLAAPSFSRGVLHHSATNILCVPLTSYKPEFRIPEIRRVLVATDFSTHTMSVIAHACSLLRSRGAVRLLHVCPKPIPSGGPFIGEGILYDPMPADSGAVPAAELKLKSLVPHDLTTAGLEFTTQALEHEDAATAICEQAGHFGADMICMGSHGHSATATILLGSVVQNVIARSQRPVLVVSPPRT